MFKNVDIAHARLRFLPSMGRIGAAFRGSIFFVRAENIGITPASSLDTEASEDCGTPRKEMKGDSFQSEDRRSLGPLSLLRILSIIRTALENLRGTREVAKDDVDRGGAATPPSLTASDPTLTQLTSIRALQQSKRRTGSWVIILEPDPCESLVSPVWTNELNYLHFSVFEVEMLNDLVACAGPSVACIILDGRFEARSLAELAIIDAKQSYPEIRSVLLESPLGEERKTDKVTWPFDARLCGPVSRARLKWAIVAGTVVQS